MHLASDGKASVARLPGIAAPGEDAPQTQEMVEKDRTAPRASINKELDGHLPHVLSDIVRDYVGLGRDEFIIRAANCMPPDLSPREARTLARRLTECLIPWPVKTPENAAPGALDLTLMYFHEKGNVTRALDSVALQNLLAAFAKGCGGTLEIVIHADRSDPDLWRPWPTTLARFWRPPRNPPDADVNALALHLDSHHSLGEAAHGCAALLFAHCFELGSIAVIDFRPVPAALATTKSKGEMFGTVLRLADDPGIASSVCTWMARWGARSSSRLAKQVLPFPVN